MKLYKLIEGKFILLQDEVDDDDDDKNGEEEDDDDNDHDGSGSDADTGSPSGNGSDTTDTEYPSLSDSEILANKKASPLFSGLHRSKGIFWLATRPNQMGSWSTAGAMLTLGSEMPWFCCVSEEDWGADEDTVTAIKNDFEGSWGDRRQEMVFIGENLDVDALTRELNRCLLGKKEMKRWEKVMRDTALDEEAKEDRLAEMWDDGYWAEWAKVEHGDHGGHDHGHSHRH